MSDRFDNAFATLIGVEGGYVNDPHDTGGETKYGISKRSYPSLDIASLTLDQAKAIYIRDYWTKIRGDDVPASVAIVLFDSAVNSGVEAAVKWAQAAVGVTADGQMGPITLSALTAANDRAAAEIMARRLVMLGGLAKWKIYGLGWSRRCIAVLAMALAADKPTTPTGSLTYVSPMPPLEQIKQAIREVQDEKVAA